MRNTLIVLAAALSSLAAALPVVEQRACKTVAWDKMYVLDEANPDTSYPFDYLFQVSQKAGVNGGRATQRHYLLVHYPVTPYGTTGCELHWNIPSNTAFVNSTGSTQLDVKQATAAYLPWVQPTWNNVVPKLEGIWGTVNAVPEAQGVINTAICSNGPPAGAVGGGYGLAFVFKYADWVEQAGNPAAVSFWSGSTGPTGVFMGPYLQYC